MISAAALVVALVSGCATVRPASPVSATPGGTGAVQLAVGTTHQELESSGRQRSFAVYRPASAPPASGYPLVVMLHGGFGSGAQAEATYGWDERADAAGFVVAYPDGINRAWNGGGCCGLPAREGVDDVAFIEAMVARIAAEVAVDPARIYATGMSNGAIMTYRLACESDLFAAVAPVAGNQLTSCSEAKPVSLLHIHGADDTQVRLDGSRGAGVARIAGPPLAQVLEQWRVRDSCRAFQSSTAAEVTTSVATCPQGRTVEWIVVAGAGHQWPGSAGKGYPGADPPSSALSATDTIWDFFASHSK